MATEWVPLLFFQPGPNADPLELAESLLAGSASASVVRLDPAHVLEAVKSTRGFARLNIDLPRFSLDNPKIDAALEGTADETRIVVRFFGNFDKLAEPLFNALARQGLVCYSVWDRKLLASWPKWEDLKADAGFAGRMSRVLERQTSKLRETEPDPQRRTRLLDAFVKSADFRAEMAREGRGEAPSRPSGVKTYADHLNCYVRWANGRPSAGELAAVRKLDPKLAAMTIAALREMIGGLPRLLLLTAAPPAQVAALRDAAARHGLTLDVEPP